MKLDVWMWNENNCNKKNANGKNVIKKAAKELINADKSKCKIKLH